MKTESELRSAIIFLLSRRDYSRFEIEQKYSKESDPQILLKLLEDFAAKGYQSDSRFAGVLVRSKTEQGFGKLRILQDARRKGLAECLVQAAITEESIDWYANARMLLERKISHPIDFKDRKEVEKRLRYLVSRGFSYDEARYALESAHTESE